MHKQLWEDEFDKNFTEDGSFKVYGTPVELKAFIRELLEEETNIEIAQAFRNCKDQCAYELESLIHVIEIDYLIKKHILIKTNANAANLHGSKFSNQPFRRIISNYSQAITKS